jgi:DNA-binding MarR family transcriptional regulator
MTCSCHSDRSMSTLPKRATTDDIEQLMLELFDAAVALRREGERTAAAGGQTFARWQLMGSLYDRDQTVPQLARQLGVTRQSIQQVANALLADGLVVAAPNPGHARSPLLHLSPAGHEASAPIVDEAGRLHARLARRVSAEDVAATRRLLRALVIDDPVGISVPSPKIAY